MMDISEDQTDVLYENMNESYGDLIRNLEDHMALVGLDGQWNLRDVMMCMFEFEHAMIEEIISNLKNGQEIMEIKNSECVGRTEKLEAILQKDICEIDEVWEGLKLTRDWLQEIESNLFSLLPYLVGSTPQSEAEKSHFEEFKSKVEHLKDS